MTDAADRRTDPGLTFEPEHLRLRLGAHVAAVPPGATNRDVLVAYVELAARSRGDSVAHLVNVRQADVEALARALDLDADDLSAEIQSVLGATRAEAARMVSSLRESRVIGGLARAATASPPTR